MKQLAWLGLLLAACGGDAGAFGESAAGVEGIYQISSYTRNDAACAPGGASVLGRDRFAVAFTQQIFGSDVLSVTSCASAADCRDKLADMRAQEPVLLDFQFVASELGANEALVGHGASTGFEEDGVCTQGEVTETRIELIGTQLRIEHAITIADDYLPDDGFCTTELSQRFARDNACSEMEVLTAELLEVL